MFGFACDAPGSDAARQYPTDFGQQAERFWVAT